MANVTVTVSDVFKEQMDERPEINWSQVAREAFEQKLTELEALEKFKDFEVIDEIAEKSELTEEDVDEIAEKIDRAVAEEFVGDPG